MNWRTHKKSLILHYRPFSCGKFLANCLSYNHNFLAQIPDQEKIESYADINVKHQYITEIGLEVQFADSHMVIHNLQEVA